MIGREGWVVNAEGVGEWGMGPRMREDTEGGLRVLRRRDSSTPLRYAQNDMW